MPQISPQSQRNSFFAAAGKFLGTVFSCRVLRLLALGVLLLYACLHFVIIRQTEQLTVREQGFVASTRYLAEHGCAAFYSYDAIPLSANLYGPVYPVVARAVLALFEIEPYLGHRAVSALFLIGSCVCLFFGFQREVPSVNRFLAVAIFYSAQVATPSIAACPDTLMVFFYLGAIIFGERLGASWAGLGAATFGLVLLFFTKPYGILVWGGYVAYLAIFGNFRWAVLNVAAAVATSIGLGLLIAHFWPAYWFSVIGVHSFFATTSGSDLLGQLRDFGILNFGVFILAATAGWRRWRSQVASLPDAWRRRGEFRPNFAWWMTGIAAVALIGRLGWHGGAYLTYFNHLLLPPLLLAVFGSVYLGGGRSAPWPRVAVGINLTLLLWLLPPWPEPGAPSAQRTRGVKMWVDPALEAWTVGNPNVELIDNAQSEYLVIAGQFSSNAEIRNRAVEWLDRTLDVMRVEEKRFVVISSIHNRIIFMYGASPSEQLLSHYRPVGTFAIKPYFLYFRDRLRFGQVELIYVILESMNSSAASSAPSSMP